MNGVAGRTVRALAFLMIAETALMIATTGCGGAETRSTKAAVKEEVPPGWKRVIYARAISMHVPAGAQLLQSTGVHETNAYLGTPRFVIEFVYGSFQSGAHPLSRLGDDVVLEDTRIEVDRSPARMLRVRREKHNPKALPRLWYDFPLGVRIFVDDAGPRATGLSIEAGCETPVDCAEVDRVIRSIKLLALHGVVATPNRPAIPLPEPRE